jgi:hypothetical protein
MKQHLRGRGRSETLSQKIMDWGYSSVVKPLLSMSEALGLILAPQKHQHKISKQTKNLSQKPEDIKCKNKRQITNRENHYNI